MRGLIGLKLENRSHLLMIVVVLLFSIVFYVQNRRQASGKKIIEGTVRILRLSHGPNPADDYEGGLPTYLLAEKEHFRFMNMSLHYDRIINYQLDEFNTG